MKKDVIIIGSGLGGLACGVILTKAGLTVGVLERASHPGGCLQSYRRGGLMFDTGLHYVGGLDDGQSLHDAFDTLGLLNLPWSRMDSDFDHVIIGKTEYKLYQGYDKFVNGMTESFPYLQRQIQSYVDKLQHITPDDMDVNAWQWLCDHLYDRRLIDVISAPAMKMELRKESLPLFSFLHGNKSYIESSWRLDGDGNMIADKMIRAITDGGGEVRCNSEVVNINDSGTDIISVQSRDGEEHTGDCFISDIHPAVLVSMLDKKERKDRLFCQRMEQCENTFGMFTTSLVLKSDAFDYSNHNAYIYDGDVWKNHTRCVMVSCKSERQIDLLTPMTWMECEAWKDTMVGHRGEAYKEMCEEKAQHIIGMAERFIPSLSDMVERKYISTPLTYRDYLGIPQGSAFGIRKDCRRSMLTYHSVRTPLDNLFLTGQNIVLSGIEGVIMTAFETCKHILHVTSFK